MANHLKAVLLFTLGTILLSCQKSSSSNPAYYFSGDFGGIEKSFNTSLLATRSSIDSVTYYLSIVGASGTEESGIVLWSDQDNFAADSTYSISALNGRQNNGLSYCSLLGSSAPSSFWNTTYTFGTVSQNFTCTITEITATYVKGTFSGVLYMSTDSAVVSKTVDGGAFYAKFF